MQRPNNTSGFTIVELLIVIVIIAILATISIVTYNGIQTRAKMTRLQATVKQYSDALTLVQVQTGSSIRSLYTAYTSEQGGGSNSSVCLGRYEDYPQYKTFMEGYCYGGISTTLPHIPQPPQESFTDYLQRISGVSFPSVRDSSVYRAQGNDNMRGLIYLTSTRMLQYWVLGEKCFGNDTAISPFGGGIHCRRDLSDNL